MLQMVCARTVQKQWQSTHQVHTQVSLRLHCFNVVAAYRVLAWLTLAVVVVDVDRAFQVWQGSSDLIDRVHHEVQHVLAVLEGIRLTPSHVL